MSEQRTIEPVLCPNCKALWHAGPCLIDDQMKHRTSKPITYVYREDFEYLLAEVKRLREILRGAPEPWGRLTTPMKPDGGMKS